MGLDRKAPGWTTGMVTAGFLCLVVVFYSWTWSDAPVVEGDSPQYMAVAADLEDGRLDALHFRTPGYPVLLALTGSSRAPSRALLLASLSLHAVATLLLWATLRGLGASHRTSGVLLVLLTLPSYVEPAAHVMTENLAGFTLAAGLAGLVRWRLDGRVGWAVVAGLFLSYAALVRPLYQLLPPAVALLCVCWPPVAGSRSRRDGVRAGAAVLAMWALIVVGLCAFHYSRFGWFGLSPAAGLHLSTRTVALVERLPDEFAVPREMLIRERDRLLVLRGGTHTGSQAIWGIREDLKAAMGLSDVQLSGYLLRMNVQLIRLAPLEYLQEVAKSAAVYWFPASGRLAAMNSSALRLLWAAIHAALVLLLALQLVVLAGWLAVRLTGARRMIRVPAAVWSSPALFAYGLGLAIIFYTMALSCFLDIGEPRQRRSTDVIFVFVCVLGLHAWRRAARAGDSDDPAAGRRAAPAAS